jgi:NADPH2:quinone reductase
MKAVYIKEFGGPENLEIRDVPEPSRPAGGEVLVRVRAAGLNRADLIQLRGHYPPPAGYSPNIPGLEFAGEVAEVGDGSSFKIGERVFGITAGEAQAEFVKIDQSLLARVPDSLSFTEAGAAPEAFVTAHDAIISQAELAPGETLLIHAAGSGVGLAALQLAKARGNTVIGTSRTSEKLERCREFGLDLGIVVGSTPEFAGEVIARSGGRGASVVLDLVGAAYFKENLKALALKGRLMIVGLTSGSRTEFDLGVALSKRLTLKGTVLRARSAEEKAAATRAFERDVVPLLAKGTIKPNVDRIFGLADVREAYEYLGSNESFGKVVLEIP